MTLLYQTISSCCGTSSSPQAEFSVPAWRVPFPGPGSESWPVTVPLACVSVSSEASGLSLQSFLATFTLFFLQMWASVTWGPRWAGSWEVRGASSVHPAQAAGVPRGLSASLWCRPPRQDGGGRGPEQQPALGESAHQQNQGHVSPGEERAAGGRRPLHPGAQPGGTPGHPRARGGRARPAALCNL